MSVKFTKDIKSELLHMKKVLTNTLKRKKDGTNKKSRK